ncbi:hypothetical protein DIPPA_06119 [Diplonema papillatum]|nr:hypothetical protein DIPPA_06119 [Diplonema papillatum]
MSPVLSVVLTPREVRGSTVLKERMFPELSGTYTVAQMLARYRKNLNLPDLPLFYCIDAGPRTFIPHPKAQLDHLYGLYGKGGQLSIVVSEKAVLG